MVRTTGIEPARDFPWRSKHHMATITSRPHLNKQQNILINNNQKNNIYIFLLSVDEEEKLLEIAKRRMIINSINISTLPVIIKDSE